MVAPIFESSVFAASLALYRHNKAKDTASAHVATGQKVNKAEDDVAVFIRSLGFKTGISEFESRQNAGKTILAPVNAALTTLENLLNTLQKTRINIVKSLSSGDFAIASRVHLQYRDALEGIRTDSNIDGEDLLTQNVPANTLTLYVDGINDIQVSAQDITVFAYAAFGNVAQATAQLTAVNTGIALIETALSNLSAAKSAIETVQSATIRSKDETENVLKGFLETDIEKESAALTALQTQINIGNTVLGLLGSGQRSVLRLFGGS